ncbi:MAG: hypothetical protein C0402_04425 [Thermodesulfovibrio sp.]|nr:hypothetical protein [Thermodesulfovibrio sp.]
MLRIKTRTIGVLLGVCIVMLLNPDGTWGAYDPPHTHENAVGCGNCHYTSGAGAPPPWMSSGSGDNTVNNLRCTQCHTLYKTHSATSTESSLWQTLGGWIVECVNCHNPHYQMQSKRWGTISYVATGTVSAVGAWQTSANQTAVTLSAPLGAEYQGYYLIPNTAYRNFLYKIKTLTNGQSQVAVKGKVGTGAVFPKAGPGTSYAIVYARNIKDQIQYVNPGAARVGSLNVKMFRPGGTRGPGDSAHTGESVCYVCHTLVSAAAVGGVADHLEPSAVCTACHGHDEGFKPSCSACHAFPPVDASGLVSTPLPTGSTTAGAHGKHATSAGMNYSCDTCHNQGMPVTPVSGNNRIQIGFNMFGTGGGSYDGQALINGYTYEGRNGTAVTTGGTKTCSNIYCHGNYSGSGKNASPKWGSTASGACGTCHNASNILTPASGKHGAHTDLAYYGFSCTLCHKDIVVGSSPSSYTIADKSRHANGYVDYKFDPADQRVAGAVYSIPAGAAKPTNGTTPRAFGSCSNVYCHSNVQPEGGIGSPSVYTNPSWGSGTAECGSCHAGGHGALIASGSHTAHLAYNFTTSDIYKCVICHSWDRSISLSCSSCHNFHATTEYAKHANYQVDMGFDPAFDAGGSASYSGTPEPGDGYGRCSNTYCHGNGTSVSTGSLSANVSPTWGTSSLTCDSCHGSPPWYSNGLPKVNSHREHALTTMAAAPTDYTCNFCHSQTTADGTSITNTSNHVNGLYNVNAGSWASFTYSYSTTGGTCTNNYCHSNAQPNGGVGAPDRYASKQWGASFAGCGSCHGKSSDHNMWYWTTFLMSSGSHTTHGNTSGCTACHDLNPAENDTCKKCHTAEGQRKHVNGQVDITFSPVNSRWGSYSGTPKPGDGYGSCSNTYCHGDSTTPIWGAPGALDCNSCHSANNALAGAHSRHYESPVIAVNQWASNNSTASEYRFNCGICHAASSGYVRHFSGPWFAVGGGQIADVAIEYSAMQDTTPLPTSGTYNRGVPAAAGLNNPDRTFSWTDGTCANTYCHSNGAYITNQAMFPLENTSAKWDRTSPDPQGDSYVCNNCHMWNIRHDAHQRHVYELNYTCNVCHSATVDACDNGSRICNIKDKSRHANGKFDVSGSSFWYTFRAYTNSTGGRCSGNTCHASQIPAVNRDDWSYNHFWSSMTLANQVPSGSTCTVTVRVDNDSPYTDSSPYTFFFDWGDSSPMTSFSAWGTWSQANHTYQNSGNYTIIWQVKDARDRRMGPPNPAYFPVNACN